MIYATDLYQAFFNSVGASVFVADAATQMIVEANRQAIKATGFQIEELRGLSIDRLFRPQNELGHSFLFESRVNPRRSYCNGLRLAKKNDETLAVNVSAIWIEWNLTKYLFVAASDSDVPLPRDCSAAESSNSSWPEQEDFPAIIRRSEKIREVCRLIGAVAKSDVTVLIQGESGTGKEIVANAIHMHSHRAGGPFVRVNCAALTKTLFESELFGHVKGAFTGAIRDRCGRFKQADGGTILLDEIGSMSLSGQAKLLRVLQEREFEAVGSSATISVDIRVIASTNVDLAKATSEGKFREDLCYRLHVFSIPLPPLRQRKEDIPLLAPHFLRQYTRALGKNIHTIAPQTYTLMAEHDWPGNVRELGNAVEHALIVENGPIVLPSSLPINLTKSRPAKDDSVLSPEMGLRKKLILLERQILLDTLLRSNGVKKHAAAMLGIDARNLPYLLRKHRVGSEFGLTFETQT